MKYSEIKPDLSQVESLLPEVVIELISLIGYAKTEVLISSIGGITYKVGKSIRKKGNRRGELLIELVGKETARIIEKHFGSEPVYVPRCDSALREWRNRQFIKEHNDMVAAGESSRFARIKLCPKYGVTDRWAQKLLAERQVSSQQLDLL
ncbi:Mor transcription activator family protein [Raoultella sp. C349492]|uniref:Mor transcription activator family protein n=2 Tax=Raoultella sp. C349492 TaxID=2970253 RepID=UPI0035C69071